MRSTSLRRPLLALAFLTMPLVSTFAVGPKAYVGNFKDNSVSVLDIASGTVLATVPVSAGPDGIVLAPQPEGPAFVSGASASAVDVIDTVSDKVLQSVEVGKGPQGLAITPDGRLLLVAVNGEDRVAWIDVAARTVVATVAVPKPHTVAVDPGGTQAYVTSQEPGNFALVRIDLRSRQVSARVALDKPPRDLEFGPDGRTLYFTQAGVAAVQVLDAGSNTIRGQIPTGISPHLAHHFAGMPFGLAVVQGPGELMLFDPATLQPLRSIAVGKQPHWMDRGTDPQQVLVSNEGSNTVSIVDLASGLVRTVGVGNAPRKIAVQHGGGAAPKAAADAAVSIADFAFGPAQLTVARGQRVTWTNRDGAPHGLKFADGAPAQDLLLPAQSFSRRFDMPGSYDYVCSTHPYMVGKVVVR